MRLLIIRHGDPDYEHDTLTEKGQREAALLADRLAGPDMPAEGYAGIYVSPLGRARDTAKPTLDRLGQEAVVCDWLQEFNAPIFRPDRPDAPSICWDWLPRDWTSDPRFFDPERWCEPEPMQKAGVRREYDRVCAGLDALVARHGYARIGRMYRAVNPNHGTVLLFAHFGVGCVLLSRLLGVSPMTLWHGACAAPTSITSLVSEERRPGEAYFRMDRYGDVAHLYVRGELPAFSARFCECFTDEADRHD